ncbi:MAG: hypothetical protein KGL04_11240 [Elusimicrobia bacterium]|nr:hypothetical protein [Elusimicrobiota bacterium]MDE2314734.1 hypothetical protein [Elusimicrobiota bacterium]
MTKTVARPTKTKRISPRQNAALKAEDAESEVTGTYVYDAELGKVVKVSGRVPKVASHGGGSPTGDVGPCGRSACAGGRCAGGGGDDF